MDIAVSLADEFLDKGKRIVYTSGTHTDKREYFSTNGGLFEKGKLVIIIDENSASASEIVAGAIQDWDRGVIIGRRSYGKGLVQRPFTFPDGSMIRLTIARYYTPSGRLIQKSYANGYKEYNNELGERAKSGEIFGNESKKSVDSIKYYTLLRKREVFGGGGITPDVYIPIDTNRFSKLYLNLNSKGLFNSFSLSYIDAYRNSIKAHFATFQEFKDRFEVDPGILSQFTKYCNEQNFKLLPAELEKSKKQIAVAIKSNIALEMWSSSEFYEITNVTDPDFIKALEVLKNWNKYTN
jgi:carboxyl-terminal processing protease